MGLFDGNKSKQIEYLDEERRKLWERLIANEKFTKELEKQVQKKATDSEKEAAQASHKAAEFRNKTEERLQEATNLVLQIGTELENIKAIRSQVAQTKNEIAEEEQSIQATIERLEESETTFEEKLISINSNIQEIDDFLEKHPDLETDLEEVTGFISKIEDNLGKSLISLTAVNKRKKEIDDLYREIFGYTETNDEDEVLTKVEGLKDELEASYSILSGSVEEALEQVETLNNNYSKKYSEFEGSHKEGYNAIKEEIKSLLPNALTAGLSSAFSSKKDNEVEASKALQKNFSLGIYLMIGVSVIPLTISIIFLIQGVKLEDTIMKIPRLVLAIIPMYIPVLWFTYSANKKLNLSKRLIEEYAHKEVLSKTYEGLSTQISNINDKAQSDELRFKLLSNFLQVSAENPGKLISNYEVSDHPIMEALEQSYKFQIAIDRLEGVPGLGKIGAMLESKAKKKLTKRTEKIEDALDSELEENEDQALNRL